MPALLGLGTRSAAAEERTGLQKPLVGVLLGVLFARDPNFILARPADSSSRPVQRALVTPRVNAGSRYRRGKSA